MPLDPLALSHLTQIALDVARQAAQLVSAGHRSQLEISHKSSRSDLVTQFDLESERLIRRLLQERAPEFPIVAEEQGGSPGAGPTWYCDPIDGTTNFAHG